MRMLTLPKRVARSKTYTRVVQSLRVMNRRTAIVASIGVLGAVVLIVAAASEMRPGHSNAQPRSTRPVSSPEVVPSVLASTAGPADASAKAAKAAPVTITGCLERADQTFRLKDTAGAAAPKSRSWKSAFLTKSTASVHIVDASNRLNLPSYVKQRVSVTGTLVDRKMQVRSVQRVATSCSAKS